MKGFPVTAKGGPALRLFDRLFRALMGVVALVVVAVLIPDDGLAVCDPVVQWVWEGDTRAPDYPIPTMMVVAQLTDDDGDGRISQADIPDVVFLHHAISDWGQMTAVDGLTGATHWVVRDPPLALGGLAAGDIDGDGVVEIVVLARMDPSTQAVAFEHDGSLKWSSPLLPGPVGWEDSIGIADLDQDGSAEIYTANSVLNADGTLRWSGPPLGGGLHFSNAADIISTSPGLELLCSGTVYDAGGGILWENPALSPLSEGSLTAFADFDGDGDPEIVATKGLCFPRTDGCTLYMLDHLGAILGTHILALPSSGRGFLSQPVIADLDADGTPEVIAISAVEIQALEWLDGEFSLKWTQPIVDLSGLANASTFDFDGDGAAEIVYGDEERWYIFDGRSGAILFSEDFPNLTDFEYPVIADIDNDCKTEILVLGPLSAGNKIIAYECAEESVLARSIWNQFSYRVTNVNDDGTIPMFEEPSWLVGNDWIGQSFTDPTLPPSDLGNGLRGLKAGADVVLSWTGVTEAQTYTLHRGTDKGAWPVPPFLEGLTATTESLPDVARPPDRYFYRVAGVTCTGLEGP